MSPFDLAFSREKLTVFVKNISRLCTIIADCKHLTFLSLADYTDSLLTTAPGFVPKAKMLKTACPTLERVVILPGKEWFRDKPRLVEFRGNKEPELRNMEMDDWC